MKDKINIDEFEQEMIEASQAQQLGLSFHLIFLFIVFSLVVIALALPRSTWLIPTKTVKNDINPYKEPTMIIDDKKVAASSLIPSYGTEYLVKRTSIDGKQPYYMIPLARYSLSGRLIVKNKFFFDKNIFDKVALIDLGIVWGDLAKNEHFNKMTSNSRKYLDNARGLMVFPKEKYRPEYYGKFDYINTHFSHTHVVPANKNIMKALNAAKYGQNIQIDGYLIDIFDMSQRRFVATSLSNTDSNESSRGGGACEVMYVMRVQLGHKVFE